MTRYAEIATDIARRLTAGEWRMGAALPSYREFAVQYRTSIDTIRSALKPLQAAGRVQTNPRRASLAKVSVPLKSVVKDSIAIVLRFEVNGVNTDGLYGQLWRGVADGVSELGCALIVLQHPHRWRSELPWGLCELPVKGLILVGSFTHGVLRQYERMNVPIVLLDQPGEDYAFHSVSVANFKAAYAATLRLIGFGHRRLAFMRTLLKTFSTIDPDARERERGFLAACKHARLRREQYKIFSAFSDPNQVSTAHELLDSKEKFSAVLTANPVHAEQLSRAAAQKRITIPQQLSVACFRDSGPLNRDWSGPMTNFEKLGYAAVNILKRKPRFPKHVQLEPAWNAGDSVSAPA